MCVCVGDVGEGPLVYMKTLAWSPCRRHSEVGVAAQDQRDVMEVIEYVSH